MEDMIKYEEETITEEVFNGEIDINEMVYTREYYLVDEK